MPPLSLLCLGTCQSQRIAFIASPQLLRFPEPNFALELGCHQVPTLLFLSIIQFSPVPAQLCIPVFPFMYTLPCCIPSCISDIPILMAMLSDSVYKTHNSVCI